VSEQNEIKALGDTLRRDWEEMKSQMSRQDASVADVKQTVETVNAAIGKAEDKIKAVESALELKIARMEQLERADEAKVDPYAAEVKAFDKWFRKGSAALTEDEVKTLATDSDVDGGFTVPAPMQGAMITLLREFSPVRSLVSVVTISQGNAFMYPKEGSAAFSAGKVGERDARSQTTNGSFAQERIPVHEFYANPWVTQTMLDDTGFDVEGWIAQRVANRRAQLEGGYHLNGTGEGEPEGILTNADISVRGVGRLERDHRHRPDLAGVRSQGAVRPERRVHVAPGDHRQDPQVQGRDQRPVPLEPRPEWEHPGPRPRVQVHRGAGYAGRDRQHLPGAVRGLQGLLHHRGPEGHHADARPVHEQAVHRDVHDVAHRRTGSARGSHAEAQVRGFLTL
jgi:hypothetical protein